jgi:toxin CcdB
VGNPDPDESSRRPYLLVLQSDLVSSLVSSVVAPLVVRDMMKGAERLNPLVIVDGREYWLATHELFAVEQRVLRMPVANLDAQRQAIIGALDLLFTGF